MLRRLKQPNKSKAPSLVPVPTDSDSETIYEVLADHKPVICNAGRSIDDTTLQARVVARAGDPGQVTVVTKWGGRGVDFPVDPSVIHKLSYDIISPENPETQRIMELYDLSYKELLEIAEFQFNQYAKHFGNGSWSRIPWISSLPLSVAMVSMSSS